jgi:hypothetical protein
MRLIFILYSTPLQACEARRLDPFTGTEYNIYIYISRKVCVGYSTGHAVHTAVYEGVSLERPIEIQNIHNFIKKLVQTLIVSADCRESRATSSFLDYFYVQEINSEKVMTKTKPDGAHIICEIFDGG